MIQRPWTVPVLCLLKIPSLSIYKVTVPVPLDFLDEFENIESELGG